MNNNARPTAVCFHINDAGGRVLRHVLERMEVLLVVTRKETYESPLLPAAVACTAGIPYTTEDVNGTGLEERVAALCPDFLVSGFFHRRIPERVCRWARGAAVNLHPSLLPAYRGATPVEWCLMNGEDHTGLTMHMLDHRFDAGGILYQEAIGIGPDDTFGEVLDRFIGYTPHALDNLLDRAARGDYSTISQDEARASYFRKRTLEDGRIEWLWDARIVHNRVRGLSPWPRARFDFEGSTHSILRSRIRNGLADTRPSGTVVKIGQEGQEAAMVCGDGQIIELFGLDPPLVLRP